MLAIDNSLNVIMILYLLYKIKKQIVMLLFSKQPKRGDKVNYERDIMFKGTERTTSKVVGIYFNRLLLDNGDSLYFAVNI